MLMFLQQPITSGIQSPGISWSWTYVGWCHLRTHLKHDQSILLPFYWKGNRENKNNLNTRFSTALKTENVSSTTSVCLHMLQLTECTTFVWVTMHVSMQYVLRGWCVCVCVSMITDYVNNVSAFLIILSAFHHIKLQLFPLRLSTVASHFMKQKCHCFIALCNSSYVYCLKEPSNRAKGCVSLKIVP